MSNISYEHKVEVNDKDSCVEVPMNSIFRNMGLVINCIMNYNSSESHYKDYQGRFKYCN